MWPSSASSLSIEPQPGLSVFMVSTTIEFGRISAENGVCRMNSRGRLLGLQGQTCLGDGKMASFDLQGASRSSVNISVLGSHSDGVSFIPRLIGPHLRALSGRGYRRLSIAGDLTLTNARDGKHALFYSMTVHYE